MIKTSLFKHTIGLGIFCIAFLVLASVQAQEKPAQLSHAERAFIAEAYAGGLAEIKMGELARTKAATPEAKTLAERLVTDHQQAGEELKQLASAKGVTLPNEPPAAAQTGLQSLEKKEGASFDKAFLKKAVQFHKKDIAKYEKIGGKTSDAELKAFIEKTLPVLKEHQALAEAAAEKE